MDNYTKEYYSYGEFVERFFSPIKESDKVSFAVNDGWDYLTGECKYCSFVGLDTLKESNFFNVMRKTHGTVCSYRDYHNLYIWVEGVRYDPNELAEYFPDEEKECVSSFFNDVDVEENYHEYVGYDSGYGDIESIMFPSSVIDSLIDCEYSSELDCYLIYGVSGNVMYAESGELATETYFEYSSDFEDIGGDDGINYCNIYSSEYEEWENSGHGYIYGYHDYDKSYNYYSLSNETRSKRTGRYLYMGTELEVDETQIDNEEIVKNALARLDSDDNVMFHCEHDGSVEFEFISQPMTYEYRWEKCSDNEINTLDYLKTVCRSHDAGTCGLHVHVNKDFFNEESYKKMKTILEFFKAELFTFSRRQSMTYNYASFIESGIDGDDEQPSDKMLDYRKDMNNVKPSKINKKKLSGHSYWYNEDSGNTFEFRMFRGTLNFNTLMATLQLVRNICFIADDPNKNVITWSDIITGYEDEGSSYGDNSYCEMYCDKRNILGSDITLEYDKAIECEEKSLVGKFELFKQNREKCIMMFEYLCQHTWFNNGEAISDFKIKYNKSLGQLELFSTSFGLKDGAISSYVLRMDQQVYNWHIIIDDKEVSNNEQLLDYENREMEKMYKNMNEYINDSQSNPKWVFEDALREFAKSYSEKNSFEVVRLARKQD